MQSVAHVWSYQQPCYHIQAFLDKHEADWQLVQTQLSQNMKWYINVHAPLRSLMPCHNCVPAGSPDTPKASHSLLISIGKVKQTDSIPSASFLLEPTCL